jgi:hypothetical protein
MIGEDTLQALKYNRGLTERDKQRLLQSLKSAHPEADRPPFFHKSHDWLPVPVRFLLWAAASRMRIMQPLYIKLASPRRQFDSVLVVKETGWSIHLESIIDGLQPHLTCFLFRHPCAVVASILRGIHLGLMTGHDKDRKMLFVREHSQEKCIREAGIDEQTAKDMDNEEYFALRWRAFTEICLKYHQENRNRTRLVVYEDLQKHPEETIRSIFSDLGLPFEEHTDSFLKKSSNVSFSSLGLFDKDSRNDFYSVYRKDNYDVRQWEKKLTHEQIDRIKKITGKSLLSEFWVDS